MIRQERLDLVHAHYAIPHSVAVFLGQQMGGCEVKTVTTLHGTDVQLVGLDPSYWEITRFGMLRSSGLTAVSQALADTTQREFHLDREVRVIPNFVDTERFARPRDAKKRARDRAPRREGAAARLELPPRQARLGGRRGLLPDRRAAPGPALHDRRRPGPAARRGGGARAGHREPRALPQGDRRRRGVVRRRRPAAAPLRDGVLRPRAARGDGLRRAGAGLPRRRPARGGRGRQERVPPRGRRRRRAWPRAASSCSPTRAAGPRSRAARARSPCSASARSRSSTATSSTSSRCSAGPCPAVCPMPSRCAYSPR